MGRVSAVMKGMRLAAIVAVAVALAAPAHADDDTDFANQLHTYGLYGQRDYNAWLAKIVCDRLHNGVDANAFESTRFVAANLARGTTPVQTWQFFAPAMSYYCQTRHRSWKTLRRRGGDRRALRSEVVVVKTHELWRVRDVTPASH
jgi:hypothetical protein